MSDSGDDILRPGQIIRPKIDKETATELVERLYGLKVKHINELNAYDDKNFHVICYEDFLNPWITNFNKEGYVLKITNSLDSMKTDFVEGQIELLIYLDKIEINAPQPVKNLNNRYYSLESFYSESEKHTVRLLVYRPGKLLHDIQISDELLIDVGYFAAKLDDKLKNFHHPAYDGHRTLWMLDSVPRLRDFVYAVDDNDRRIVVNEIIKKFEDQVIGNIDKLEKGIIHGDLNEQNILVDESEKKVSTVLDLGDSQKSCLIFELAIAMCYMLLKIKDIARGKYVLEGYQRVRKLSDFERKIFKICVCARICQSLVLGAYSHLNDPRNEYLLVTQKPGWALLEQLWPMDDKKLLKIWE